MPGRLPFHQAYERATPVRWPWCLSVSSSSPAQKGLVKPLGHMGPHVLWGFEGV